jgi:hypothetical protein
MICAKAECVEKCSHCNNGVWVAMVTYEVGDDAEEKEECTVARLCDNCAELFANNILAIVKTSREMKKIAHDALYVDLQGG